MFAEVRVIETWLSEHYSSVTGECLREFPVHDAPQTVFLERVGDEWMVQSIVHDNETGPDPVACQ